MLRPALLSLILFVALSSSTSVIRKSIARRQTDPQYCQAIEGFDCKCSYYRVTCINDQNLPSTLNVLQNEKHKYQSVELVITAATDINVNDRTFEAVKELYKSDADSLEFRVKFEKFTSLRLASPGIFNRVFPDNLPSHTRKTLALEIYNPEVQPSDDPHLFKNLNADTLELYALYPFHGTFQQLFDGANIKYLRLSGGDIRSDASQPFTGNVGRLELAKQANALSAQNFPVYPAHELIVNAFYITDFNDENPPNYKNLVELRVNSPNRIPANAFRQFPNLRTLSVTSEQGLEPHALDGLNSLEKLTIKDAKAPLDILNSLPNIKEFDTNIEKLDETTQCQLLEKLANGQVAIQAIPNGRECTCVSAYLEKAAGQSPCKPEHCEHSPCAAIKNNYDASTREFKAPPAIRRSDGSDALQQREQRVYNGPFQVAQEDQEKLQRSQPHHAQQPQAEEDFRRPNGGEQNPEQPYNPQDQQGQDQDGNRDGGESPTRNELDDNRQDGQGNENPAGKDNNEDPQEGGGQDAVYNPDTGIEGASGNGTEISAPQKKGMSWLPIIIIVASIVGLLLIGLVVLFLRKRRTGKAGYNTAPTGEQAAVSTRA